jgi:predicted signal transduction protein with EAL and GGDEF domain
MTSTKGRLQLALIAGGAFLIASLGITAMFALSQSSKRSREKATFLYQLEANAQGLNANEWEAIASLKIDPELHESSEHLRREILNDLQKINALQGREGFADNVQPTVSTYLSAMDEEFVLVSNGQFDRAQELDHSRVDPSFAILEQTIHEDVTELEAETQRSAGRAFLSSVGTLLACLASILFLALRFERGRNLQKTNARLQELVTQLSLSQEKLTHTAYHDLLTQLPNRAFFMDRLTQCVKRAKRHQDYKFAVVFMDVDQFKIVNDSLGHSAGDQLISQISERLTGSIRRDSPEVGESDLTGLVRPAGNDLLARYGGDEFAVVLDDIRDARDGIRVAERIQRNLETPFLVSGRQLQISVSTGIAVSATGYSAAEDVLHDADTAMHRAKAVGTSRYLMCDPAMHAMAVHRLRLEDELRQAAARGELLIHYQPIVSLHDGHLSGFEALVRWQRPDFGLVAPGEFIPLAEETGLIVTIGSWVLRQACSQMCAWHLQFPSEPPLTIAVNFSAKQFIQPDLIEQMVQILRESHLDPGSLGVEFTESVAMQDVERTARVLSELKVLGVHTSIDDFGTGYSSLSHLRRLPLDILKLDRSFLSEMDNSNESREIVRTVISLAHILGMDVVAEGIETAEQADQLRSFGCKYAQGYFFSKPMNRSSVEALLGSGLRYASLSDNLLHARK